jgi:Peptidase inhibitor I78 family
MLKPIIAALAIGALAGCIAIEVNDIPDSLPRGGALTCDAGAYQSLVGKREGDIGRSQLPAVYRIVCADCAVTQDHNPNRLNIHLGTDNRVSSVRCG